MEKILKNVDILYEIIQHLNFEDQLQLANVCTQFRLVIKDFIWKNKYKYTELEVNQVSRKHYILNNNIYTDSITYDGFYREVDLKNVKDNKFMIKRNLLSTFLPLIVGNVEKLAFRKPNYAKSCHDENDSDLEDFYDEYNYIPMEFGFRIDGTNQFTNLISMTYRCIFLSVEDLQLLDKTCPKLETLRLQNCFFKTRGKEKPLIIGFNISMSVIQNMTALKCLEYDNSLHSVSYNRRVYNELIRDLEETSGYKHKIEVSEIEYYKKLHHGIEGILKNLHIQQLEIHVNEFSLTNDLEDEKLFKKHTKFGDEVTTISNPCEILKIGYFSSQCDFNKFNATILISFKSLRKLTLVASGSLVNEDFFNSVSKTCIHLKYLNLQHFRIMGFISMYTLEDLVIENCSKLKWLDLKLILNDMRLKSFTLSNTENIDGNFEYFNVAPTLEHLHIINYAGKEFNDLFELNNGQNFKNLSSFIYYNESVNYPYDYEAKIPTNIAANCLKIKQLSTLPCQILINNLCRLEFLKELTLHMNRKIDLSDILKILKHSKLNELTLRQMGDGHLMEYKKSLIKMDISNEAALLELANMKTNVIFINLPLETFFHIKEDIWYMLLSNNRKLKIIIHFNETIVSYDIINKITWHPDFPKHIKSINYNGYILDLDKYDEDDDWYDDFDEECEEIEGNTFEGKIEIISQQTTDYESYLVL